MKRMVCALCALVCPLVLAASAMAQSANVTGEWNVTINWQAIPHEAKASFKQEGEKLTGVIKSRFGEKRLEGTVKGKDIEFNYTVEISDMIVGITLSGAVEGDSMKGDVEAGRKAEGDWSAKRASAATAAAAQSSGEKRATKLT